MNQPSQQERWFIVKQLLLRTEKEVRYLSLTSERIKALNIDINWVENLEQNISDSEMLDAFVSRFSRLQDTLGDKLLLALLRVSLETTGSQLDNLLRAEKMGWIVSTEKWIEIRTLRSRLVHEYMDSTADLLTALIVALNNVAVLIDAQTRMAEYARKFISNLD